MAKSKLSDEEQVDELINQLDPAIKETVQTVRKLVLSTDSTIAEQVKWNSPSFYCNGEMKPFDPKEYKRDIMVCNIHRGKILLVFPTGAKIKSTLKGKDYPDGRKIITIESLAEVKDKAEDLQLLIRYWLRLIDK